MAEYIPNQPVYFGDDDVCSSDEIDYKQLVDNSDTTQFQLRIGKCPGVQDIVINGTFDLPLAPDWSPEGLWYVSSGRLGLAATNTTAPAESPDLLVQSDILTAGEYYEVDVTVYSISGGGLNVFIGENLIGTIYSAGTYQFYGYAITSNPLIAVNLVLQPTLTSVAVLVDSISVYPIQRDFVVIVRNIADEYIDEFSFDQNPDLFVFAKDTVTITIPWQDINAENGCYYLCVLDPCVNANGQNYPAKILNCSFTTETGGWGGYPGYTWSPDGYIITSIATVGPINTATQNGVFSNYSVDYHVTIDVVITGSAVLDVYFGTALITTITGTGTFNAIGKAVGTLDLSLKSRITSTPGTVRINSACPSSVIYGNADIENCEFDDGIAGWSGDWEAFASSDNGLLTELSTGTPVQTLIQENVFGNTAKEYGIRLRAGILPGEDITFRVYFGTALVQTITTTGNYDIYGYPTSNSDLKIEVTLNSGASAVASIFFACPIERDSEFQCDFTSNYFKIADFSNACTILINACNNDDGLGFVFDGSGFSPRVRINAKLKQPKYPAERSMYDDSEGTRRNTSFRSRKAKNLTTELEPVYIHDFLSTLRGYDTVYLDSVEYVCDDTEYNIDYGDMDYHGKVKVLFSEKTQNVANNNCSDQVNNCRIAESFLLQADDPNSFVTQTDGSLINING